MQVELSCASAPRFARARRAFGDACGVLALCALSLLIACGDDADPHAVPSPIGDASSPVVAPAADAALPGSPSGGAGNFPSGPAATGGAGVRDAGAGPGGSSGAAGASDPVWCKAQEVFTKYCVTCHDGQMTAGAPMALKSYADLIADSKQYPGTKIFQRASTRMHLPASMKPMPPQGTVAPEDMKAVDDWIAAGAKGSSAACGGGSVAQGDAGVPGGDFQWPPDCEEKFKFVANSGAGKPFQVGAREFYQDFTFQAPWTDGNVQAVGFRSITDNKKVLHHWILYQGSAFLVGWSPGKNEKELPSDIGVYMPGKGNTLKLTVHYYNTAAGAKTEMDASGVEVCVTKKPRPKTAFTFPFAANPDIPANAPMTTNSATCTVSSQAPVHIITSSPHMHKRGIGAKFEILRSNGMVEVMHDKAFNFEEQTTWPVDYTLNSGDKVRVTCIYKNTGLPATSFGTSTDQEMCFNFALYYPMCGMTCANDDILAGVWQSTQGNGCPTAGGGAAGGLGGVIGGLGGTGGGALGGGFGF